MAYVVPGRAETREDQRLYTQARMVDVACLDCTVHVSVKKNSEHHTSVQWGPDGPSQCPEFVSAAGGPGGRHLHTPCARLAASIDAAVREGRITIGAEDGW